MKYYIDWKLYWSDGVENYTIETLCGGTLAYIIEKSPSCWDWAVFERGAGRCSTLEQSMYEVETLIHKNGWIVIPEHLKAMV